MIFTKNRRLPFILGAVMCLALILGICGISAAAQTADGTVTLKVGDVVLFTVEEGEADWYSSDPSVCTCYGGLVVAQGEGKADIYAICRDLCRDYTYSCRVIVESAEKTQKTAKTAAKQDSSSVNVKKGKTASFTVKSSVKDVKFKYTGTKNISVSIKAKKNGEYLLTVKGKEKGSAAITVYDKNNKNNSMVINVTVSDKASTENAYFTFGSGSSGKTSKQTDKSAAVSESGSDSYADEVIRLVNEERKSRGIPALKKDDTLCKNAETRVIELGEKFSHTRPNGKSCFSAITVSYGYSGENIAKGQRTPEEAMDSWMNSAGHKKNILSKNYTKIGVAYDSSTKCWVQLFISD